MSKQQLYRWFSRIEVRTTFAVGILLALLAIMFASNVSLTRQSMNLLDRSAQQTFPILQLLDQILVNFREHQDAIQAAVAANDEFSLDDAGEYQVQIVHNFQEIKALDAGLGQKIAELESEFQNYAALADQLARQVIMQEISMSGDEPLVNEFLAAQNQSYENISILRDDINELYHFEVALTEASGQRTIQVGGALIVIAIFIGLLVLRLFQKSIVKPLIDLTAVSLEVANGRFTKARVLSGDSEVAHLSRNFNQMIESLESNATFMAAIIEYGRTIAISANLLELKQSISMALNEVCGSETDCELWVGTSIFKRFESAGDKFQRVDQQGNVSGREENLGFLQSKARKFFVESHRKDKVLAVIVLSDQKIAVNSEFDDFLTAISINIASALDSIKLQDTLALVREQSESIRKLLANIDQGICSIDAKRSLVGSYSPFLEKILGRSHLADLNIIQFLLDRSNLDDEKSSLTNSVLDQAFGENVLALETNRHLLPKELVWLRDSQQVVCEIDWIPLVDEQDIIQQIMLVIRDVSQLRQIQASAEAHSKKLKILEAIFHVDQIRLKKQMDNLAELMEMVAVATYRSNTISHEKWQQMNMKVHTLKGNFRVIGLSSITTLLHRLESILLAFQSSLLAPGLKPAPKLSEFDELIHSLKLESSQVLNLLENYFEPKTMIDLDLWDDEMLRLMNSNILAKESSAAFDPKILDSLRTKLWKSMPWGIWTMERRLKRAIESDSLGRESNVSLVWLGESYLCFRPIVFNQLLDAYHHLIQNSLSHGFNESRSQDFQIEISAKVIAGRELVLRYRDNGRGLNIAKLREEALRIDGGFVRRSDEELADIVFNQGYSTATQVSESAGRGVGMGAVRDIIRSLGGDASVSLLDTSTSPGYRAFVVEFRLPIPQVLFNGLAFDHLGAA